jgi:hypothetical protein
MKYIKRLSIGLVIAVLSSGIFIGLFPQKAFAASLSYEDQYIIVKSANLLARCVGGGGYTPGDSTVNAQDSVNNIFMSDIQLVDGKLYSRLVGSTNNINNGYDCNTLADVNPALRALGFKDINDFYEKLGLSTKKGDPKVSKQTLIDKILAARNEKGVSYNTLKTPEFLYWYWKTVFSDSLAKGGCSGTLGDQADANKKTSIEGTYYFVEKDGKVTPYTYARYDTDTGREVEGLDDTMTGIINEGNPTCRIVAIQLTKERAEAFAESLKTNDAAAAANTNSASAGGNGEGGNGDDEINIQCALRLSNPLSYFMCPLTFGFIQAMNALDSAITQQLTVDTAIFTQDPYKGQFEDAWTNMRNLAISFIVIVGLLMVIGTAVEVGPFDPYTVKKVMPRLLVAVIVISLSWPLVIFLIDASNSLGFTVKGLIQQPFTDLLGKDIQISGGQQWAAVAGFAGAGVALGLVGLLSFVATAFLGVTLAFLVLILRQILVILLAVIAPIAIAMYIHSRILRRLVRPGGICLRALS